MAASNFPHYRTEIIRLYNAGIIDGHTLYRLWYECNAAHQYS